MEITYYLIASTLIILVSIDLFSRMDPDKTPLWVLQGIAWVLRAATWLIVELNDLLKRITNFIKNL